MCLTNHYIKNFGIQSKSSPSNWKIIIFLLILKCLFLPPTNKKNWEFICVYVSCPIVSILSTKYACNFCILLDFVFIYKYSLYPPSLYLIFCMNTCPSYIPSAPPQPFCIPWFLFEPDFILTLLFPHFLLIKSNSPYIYFQ